MFIFIFLKKAKAMKKIVLIVLIFITTVGFSQTDVSGALSSDTTWSLSNSPIILTGNVLVPNGVTLTIEAGVTVRINSEKYLKVQGSLIAIGTESNKITFTSNESSPAKGDWDKIWLASTSTSFDGSDNYVSGTIFNHCIISYADEGLRLDDSSFYLVNSELTENNKGINFRKVINSVIDNNNFNNNGSGTSTSAGTEDNGIGSFTFTKFLNNTFKNNTGDGLSFGGYRNNANNNLIKNNISINNGGNGFYFGWGDVVRGFADNTIDGNIIYNNSGNGITVGRDSNIIKKNFIVNNEGSGINISGTYIYEGLTIENNIISGNLGYGLDLTSNTNSLIRYNSILNSGGNSENPSLGIPNSYIISNNNTITYNTIYASENSAIELRYGPNTFNNNNFISTKGNYIFKLLTENNSDINAENNYWGTSTESEIQSVIYDYSDDFELGAVDYTPFLTSPNTDAPISPPSNVTKQASGSDIVLSWSANGETDIAGYKLHYGSPTGYSYSTTVDLGNVTTYTVTGGDITTEYSITAYDSSIDGTDDMVDGNESWFSLAIAAVNDPPVAYYSDVAATEQTPVTITLTGYDPEEQALTYIITSIPQDGTLSDNGTEIKSEDLPKTLSSSDITYVSTSDSAVDDNFVFKVNDGELDSTSAYIDIYIEAVFDDPIAESNTVEATEQVTLNFTLGGLNPDDNGINVDELVFIITSLPENGTLFENNNTYEIKDEDLPHTILDNDIWYTSTSDSATTDSFTFKVNADVVNDSEAATVSIAITAVNDVPVAFADTETVDEDAATTSINVIANDTDVDTGDTLELTAVDIAGTGTGTVGINADGLSVDYTPAFNFNGTETITYTVSDGELTDTTGTLTITVTSVNDAPTITSTAETAATEDVLYSYTIATNDVDEDVVTLTSSDLPSWLTLSGDTFTGSPLEGDVGAEITITATDNGEGSLTATQTFTIVVTPVNDAPTITSTAVTAATEDVAYSYTITSDDVDGDTITLTSSDLPSWLTLSGNTLIGTPLEGDVGVEITITATDNGEGSLMTTQTFTIVVTPVNDAPVAVADTATVLEDAETTSIDVITNDTDDGAYTDDGLLNNGDFEGGSDFWIVAVNDALPAPVVTVAGNTYYSVNVTSAGNVYDVAVSQIVEIIQENTYTLTFDAWSDTNRSIDAGIGLSTAPWSNDKETIQISPTRTTFTLTLDSSGFGASDARVLFESGGDVGFVNIDNVSLVLGDGTEFGTLNLTAVSTSGSGTVDINLDGLSVDYTPAANFNETETITYTVSDGVLTDATGTLTITVTPVNDAPVAVADTATVLEDDETTRIDVITNDTDVEADSLTLKAVTTTAGTGTVAVNEDSVSVDYTPALDFNGTEVITYAVSDGTVESTGTLTITVTAVNDAPTITSTAETAATEDMLYSYTIATNDVDADDLVTLTSSDLPSWLALTGNVLSGTPLEGDVGVEITITAIDDGEGSLTATQTFTIVVTAVNDAPVVSDHVLFLDEGGIATTLDNSEISLLYNASDIEDDSFIAIIESEPAYGILVLNTDGTFSYTHDGSDTLTDSFSYRADDSNLTSEIGTVSITIIPNNDNIPTDIILSNNSLNENADSANGYIIGQFTAIDLDLPSDIHTFELVAGDGDTDNNSFVIDGNNLKTFTIFDYETQESLSIRVITIDAENQSFEKSFTIDVINIGDISIESQVTNSYCEGDAANGSITISNITNTTGDLVFSWSVTNDGSIPIGQEANQNLTDLKGGTYTIVISDDTDFTLTEEFQINLTPQYSALSICYVSSDEEDPIKNRIFLNNQGNYNVSLYEVLKETSVANEYEVIGTMESDEISFLDEESNNQNQTYNYKVRLIDTCGDVSPDSQLHKTILLQSNLSANNSINLNWSDYEGTDYSTYKIYRKINGGIFEELVSLSSSSSSYNDSSADISLGDTYEYYVSIVVDQCNTDLGREDQLNTTELKSNRLLVSDGTASVEGFNNLNQFEIYPNPAKDNLNIKLSDGVNFIKGEVYNSIGQLILITNKINFSIKDLSDSVYFIKIYSSRGIMSRSFIKN